VKIIPYQLQYGFLRPVGVLNGAWEFRRWLWKLRVGYYFLRCGDIDLWWRRRKHDF
jgi:hypothetical protein